MEMLLLQMSSHKHASFHCCGMQMLSISGMNVPFSELHEHGYRYCFSYGTKDCLQTNYGGTFIAVPSFMYPCLL